MKPHHTESKCQPSFLLYLSMIHANCLSSVLTILQHFLANITPFLQGYRHVTASSRGRQGDLVSMPTAFTQNGHCFMVQEPLKNLDNQYKASWSWRWRKEKWQSKQKNVCSRVCVKVSASPHPCNTATGTDAYSKSVKVESRQSITPN